MINTIKDHRAKYLILSALIIPLFLTGCGLWGDFTTYFNLYYNASRLFNETEEDIVLQRKALFTIQDPKLQGSTSQNLTKVIEKCSKLLQFDAKSGYVDDALLMIGKSFYYQQDYLKALRKFTELISTFPNSDLALEDQLWIGKTQLRLKNYTQANSILDEVRAKAQEEKNKDILTQAFIEQVSYLIAIEKYDDAITAAKNLVESSGNDEINASAMYEIGKLYLKIDQPENAAKAFADVQKYSPVFETEYLAKIHYGKVQRQLGKSESALDIFKNIESEAKYNSFLDSTKLQIGITYMDLKRYEDAMKQMVFIDTTFKQSPNAGTAEYYMGEILEKNLANYDSANFYYKKVATSTAPAEFIQKSNRKVQIFTKYNNLHSTINLLERQLVYLEKPEEFVQDSVNFARELALQDSLNKEKEKQKGLEASEFQASRNSRTERQQQDPYLSAASKQNNVKTKTAPVRPSISADSIRVSLAKNEYELGGLFFTELNIPDSAYYYYSNILDMYPNTPYKPRTLFALGTYYQTKNDTVKADSLFNVIYSQYPNESIVNAAADKLGKPTINLSYDAAEELYVAAEKKMKDKDYNEAITGFKEVYNKYPKSPFAAKALYASGWVLENDLKQLDSAAVVYDSVISKYPSTKYANAVRGEVGIYKDEQRKIKAAQDSAKAKLNPPVQQAPVSDSLNGNNAQQQGNPKLPNNIPAQTNNPVRPNNPAQTANPAQTGNPPIQNSQQQMPQKNTQVMPDSSTNNNTQTIDNAQTMPDSSSGNNAQKIPAPAANPGADNRPNADTVKHSRNSRNRE